MSSRLEAIRNYKVAKENEEAQRKLELARKVEESLDKIRALAPRIAELIDTANECVINGICIDEYSKSGFYHCYDSYKKGTFVTNGISHRVGFYIPYRTKEIEYMGIENGGCNGRYNLVVDCDGTALYVNKANASDRITPDIYDLNKFLARFDEFESAFYAYVDRICLGK